MPLFFGYWAPHGFPTLQRPVATACLEEKALSMRQSDTHFRYSQRVGCAAVFLVFLVTAGCTLQTPSPRVVTPTAPPATPTAIPETPTPTVTPTPTPTPTPTVVPTPDPATLLATAEAGLSSVSAQAGEARLICLRYEDTDADGQPEWLALVHREAPQPRIDAFVLDGEVTHVLQPAPPKPGVADVGFGQYATCDLTVRDVNADGIPEIAILGHAANNETLLHLFAWEGTAYRRLGFFSGDAGVKFADVDGDLEEEIWEGYRVGGAPSLAWFVVHTWRNGTYGWTSDRYGWYFADRPQAYPTHGPEYVVISFYLALQDRDLPGAHGLLLADSRPPFEAWATGYATTARVSVGGVHTISGTSSENQARVAAMVTAWDNEGGVIVGRLWDVEWDAVRTEGGWRLARSTADMLEEWKVSYWP